MKQQATAKILTQVRCYNGSIKTEKRKNHALQEAQATDEHNRISEKYDTEDKCREELFKMRYPKGFKCSKCECTEYYYLKSKGKYHCKNCKHQSSVTSGTVMNRSHLKLTVWLWVI